MQTCFLYGASHRAGKALGVSYDKAPPMTSVGIPDSAHRQYPEDGGRLVTQWALMLARSRAALARITNRPDLSVL